jgi:hypothetical protein|eukprot:COSAG03_NODE_1659_length_3707_cov_3.524698_4_plen_32_part_00
MDEDVYRLPDPRRLCDPKGHSVLARRHALHR